MSRAAALVAVLLLGATSARAGGAEPADAVPDESSPPPATDEAHGVTPFDPATGSGGDRSDGGAPIIELYTMGQGDLMFEKFGHAALCIRYPRQPRRTRCYNYGSTDFDSVVPLFLGFLR